MRTPSIDAESSNDKLEEADEDFEGDESIDEFDSDEYDSRYTPHIDEYDDDFETEGLF